MIKRLSTHLILLLALFSTSIKAQSNDDEKFIEALYLIDENRFSEAQNLLEDIYPNDKGNANINYNLGLSYLNSFVDTDKEKALPYLTVAASNVSPKYKPFNVREEKAPIDAFYHLAIAQHHNYQFAAAKENLEKFRKYINEKHYLWKELAKRIKMADYAQLAISNPVDILLTNLGGELNSFYPDYSPVVRIDESAIYFTSRRLRADSSNMGIYDTQDGMFLEDLYVAFRDDETQTWGKAQPLNINTTGHEATINLSVDGRTLYIYKDDNGNGELYESNLLSDSAGYETWSPPKKLGSNINSKAYETHVTISPDGKHLYFISDREGGLGGKDIYVCNILPTGKWALARNIGPQLNTEFNEDGVYMHPDGKTLYFSSDGHESMGGYDILYSTLSDSGWSKPINMGYPINSTDDDVFFITTPDGKRAYFSSFKEGGFGEKDIYMLQLIDAEETAITLYRGEFTFINQNTPPEGATVSIINNDTGEPVGYYTPRQRDGQFSAILETNTSYHFVYEAENYETYEEDIYVPSSSNYQEIYKEIKLKPVRVSQDGITSIEPEALTSASVKGSIAKGNVGMAGVSILLKDEGKNLLEQTETDNLGEFQFKKLDPSNTYLMEIVAEDLNPLLGFTIDLVNDRGEKLSFEKIDDKTYIFVPSTHPYEYYGISARAISGKIKKAGKPIAGLNVSLQDEGNGVIQQKETDTEGEFQFQKLRLDKKYRIVFDGDFPDDPEMILTNDFGQKLQFKKVSEGIYEYVPMGSQDLGNQMAGIIKNAEGVPLNNLKIRLENGNQEMLEHSTTDEVGQFNFESLDLDKSYRIVFEGDVPDESSIVIFNEFGRELNFFEVDKGVYEYVPMSELFTAKVISADGPLPDTYVRIEDEKRNLISRFKTDEIGEFKFRKLDLEKDFWVVFEEEVDESISFIILTEKQEEIKLNREGGSEFHYVAPPLIEFTVEVLGSEGPLPDTYVRIEDEKRDLISRFKTDELGVFKFKKLDLDKDFWIVFEEEVDENIELKISADVEMDIKLKRESMNEYHYIPPPPPKQYMAKIIGAEGPLPNTFVRIEDSNRKLINRFKTDQLGEFKFNKLDLDKDFWVVFEEEVDESIQFIITTDVQKEITLKRESGSEFHYIPPPAMAFKSYTVDVTDVKDSEETYPRPEELKNVIAYFQRYFVYNAKDINKSNKEFVAFVNDIAELVNYRGYADIMITSSASKVPTRTYKSNSLLTKKRAYDTKALLEMVFKSKGITKDQYNFIDVNTLVTGPEYKGDYLSNKALYEKYQYVRIFVK